MAILFLVVFINLIGFGLIIPLIPFYADHLNVGPTVVTLTIAAYSLAQFVTSPITGKLSDRFGRRPILLWTLAGTILSYLILGIADNLTLLLISRIFGGIMAGNIGTAYAYATDMTTEENRSKGMGLIGAAFGLGFIFGPVMGGYLAGPDVQTANYLLPALAAAGLSGAAFLGVFFLLPESLTPELREELRTRPKVPLKQQLRITFSGQIVAMFVIVGFLFVTSWALFESIFALWANRTFHFGPSRIGMILSFVGVIGAAVQGGLIGPLTKALGEKILLVIAILLVGIGYVMLALAGDLSALILALSVLAVGGGIFNPAISSLVSKEAAPTERGFVLGVYQSASSLARVIGPSVAGFIFGTFGHGAPYYLGAALMVPALFMSWVILRHKHTPASAKA